MRQMIRIEPDDALRERFRHALPFPHVVIDEFFEPEIARRLHAQFPANAASERKVTHPDLAALGGVYAQLDAFARSDAFARWIGAATGIAGLQYDPSNFGGGTHENFAGSDLRPHVDFNYHPVSGLHRRVNLIVYLNPRWNRAWGGAIELYDDPRRDAAPAVSYEPLFNRCIIFETSERSWHGFDRIVLPEGERATRKSISIYLYTRERPESETVSPHTTFYVPRPLPQRYVQGHALTAEDASELRALLQHRDRLIELYQRDLGRRESDTAAAARLRIRCAELESQRALPVLGYVRTSDVSERYADGWAASQLAFTAHAVRALRAVTVRVRVPDGVTAGVTLEAGGATAHARVEGCAELTAEVDLPAGRSCRVSITTDTSIVPKSIGTGDDERSLGLFLESALFEHR